MRTEAEREYSRIAQKKWRDNPKNKAIIAERRKRDYSSPFTEIGLSRSDLTKSKGTKPPKNIFLGLTKEERASAKKFLGRGLFKFHYRGSLY